MKKLLYWIFIAFWFNLALLGIVPSITFAGYWDDDLGIIPGFDTIIDTNKGPDSTLLDTIKNAINWFLAILATIAVAIIIYAWFKMLTSWGDSKWYDAWLKIIKNAAIWLVIIGLAWLIVSAIYWFIEENADGWWTL